IKISFGPRNKASDRLFRDFVSVQIHSGQAASLVIGERNMLINSCGQNPRRRRELVRSGGHIHYVSVETARPTTAGPADGSPKMNERAGGTVPLEQRHLILNLSGIDPQFY